jgi:hypothetical protein
MEQKRKARFQSQVVAADRKHWEEYYARTTEKLDVEVTQSQAYIVAAEREYWEEIRAQAAELDANVQGPESSYPSDLFTSLWNGIKHAIQG